MAERDFLDEVVDERTNRNPDFPALVDAAQRRRCVLLAALAERRRKAERSRTALAAAMQSWGRGSPGVRPPTDARLSTLDRYAHDRGRVEYILVP